MPAQVIETLLSAVPPLRAWRQYLGLGEDELAAMAGLPLAEVLAAERRDSGVAAVNPVFAPTLPSTAEFSRIAPLQATPPQS